MYIENKVWLAMFGFHYRIITLLKIKWDTLKEERRKKKRVRDQATYKETLKKIH